MDKEKNIIEVKNLTVGYGNENVLEDISFSVNKGDIFAILGGSGSGKSTILKHLIGLEEPLSGTIKIDGEFLELDDSKSMLAFRRKIGVMYQSGALFSSMSIFENVCLPLEEHTDYPTEIIESIAMNKLSLVGLAEYFNYFPHELSGGMKKRAAIARAMALEPKILFLDEPSAGLDPVTSHELDTLILNLKKISGTTMVMVTHELDSIYSIVDDSIFIDADTKSIVGKGSPSYMLDNSNNSKVKSFLKRRSR